MSLSAFIERCDRFCEASGKSRVWLSKRLLGDTYHLDRVVEGKADIGARRLERLQDDLTDLERDFARGAAA